MNDSGLEGSSSGSRTCCFIGHRTIENAKVIENMIHETVERLITEENIGTFLFGSKSRFDDLCYNVISKLKEKYPHIKRVYVRAEYPYIDDDYKNYLLQSYEDTYYPNKVINAGKAAYVERNFEMIDKSDFCVVYYVEDYQPPRRKNGRQDLSDYQPRSGTKLAYDYAVKQKKNIVNLFVPTT